MENRQSASVGHKVGEIAPFSADIFINFFCHNGDNHRHFHKPGPSRKRTVSKSSHYRWLRFFPATSRRMRQKFFVPAWNFSGRSCLSKSQYCAGAVLPKKSEFRVKMAALNVFWEGRLLTGDAKAARSLGPRVGARIPSPPSRPPMHSPIKAAFPRSFVARNIGCFRKLCDLGNLGVDFRPARHSNRKNRPDDLDSLRQFRGTTFV